MFAFCSEYMQNACMATSITIRNVPNETHRELAARAALAGQSLQEYLRAELVEIAQRPDIKTWMKRVTERVNAEGNTLSAEQILEYIDLGREGQ